MGVHRRVVFISRVTLLFPSQPDQYFLSGIHHGKIPRISQNTGWVVWTKHLPCGALGAYLVGS